MDLKKIIRNILNIYMKKYICKFMYCPDSEYGYEMSSTANLSMILGAIRSFSAFQTLCKVKGLEEGESFIQQVKTR